MTERIEHTMLITHAELPNMMPVILANMWGQLKATTSSMEYRLLNDGSGSTAVTVIVEIDTSTEDGRNQFELSKGLLENWNRLQAS